MLLLLQSLCVLDSCPHIFSVKTETLLPYISCLGGKSPSQHITQQTALQTDVTWAVDVVYKKYSIAVRTQMSNVKQVRCQTAQQVALH